MNLGPIQVGNNSFNSLAYCTYMYSFIIFFILKIAGYRPTFGTFSEFEPIHCFVVYAVNVHDFIHLLCNYFDGFTIRSYDVSVPHDLLMITFVDEIEKMYNSPLPIGIRNTNTFYIGDRKCKCIFKINTDNNMFGEWLWELGEEFRFSMANNNSLLVAKVSEDLPHLEIYDEAAKLVRSVSLPKDFKYPLYAIQKPDGEFIVSHRSKESDSMCVSFLSSDGKILSQFKLRETVGLMDVQVFEVGYGFEFFAIEMSTGNVYMYNWETEDWDLANHSVITSNSTGENSRDIVGFRDTNGQIFGELEELRYSKFVELFWDTDNRILFVAENTFGNVYLFDTQTFQWSQVGRRDHNSLYYDTKKNLFIVNRLSSVEVWALKKY